LYKKIPTQGGIVSEFPMGYPPLSHNFPLRNRIISGLADIVLVIEAKERSGSLITVDSALEQGKTVYALPGRVCDELSRGCNQLISQGAAIAYSPETVLSELGVDMAKKTELSQKKKIGLESKKNMVYSCLDLEPQNLNRILEQVSLSYEETTGILLELELDGLIIEAMKNYYARVK
jgi:DNA processing protein